MKRRNRWGKSNPATVNYWQLTYSPGGLRHCKCLSQALVQSLHGRVNLHTICQIKGRGKVSAGFWPRNSLLDLRNIPQEEFSWTWLVSTEILHSDKSLICPKISTGLKWRHFRAPQNIEGLKTTWYFLWQGKTASSSSEWMWLHMSTPYSSWVRSIRLILFSKINFPLKMLLFEMRKSPGPAWKRLWGNFAALAMVHGRWKEPVYYCVCKQGFFCLRTVLMGGLKLG